MTTIFTLRKKNGFLEFHLQWDHLFIDLIHVDKDYRRAGLGTELLTEFLAFADGLHLEVQLEARGDVSNEILTAWYEKHGFQLQAGTPEWINAMTRYRR